MSKDLEITARNLGSLTLAKYCPRCLWYLLRLRFHAPFNSFGAGIFNAMERAERAVVTYYLDDRGCLPKEFSPFCDCTARIEYPNHWSKFRYQHESGVILYGVPDDIFKLEDETLCVLDYKTAKAKGNDDPFHGQYEVQVVGYANIAEVGLGLGTVALGGLLYWEVQTDDVLTDPKSHYDSKTLYVPFKPSTVEITINYGILDPLLKEAKKVWKTSTPPDGADGCSDCKKLDLLFALEQGIEAHDAWELRRSSFRDARSQVLSRGLRRQGRRKQALQELAELGDLMFQEDGVTANWEFLHG
jgi:hypothetical protein